MPLARLQQDQTAVLLLDMQEKLVPHMHNAPSLVRQCQRLLDGANALGVPVLVTEQYRQGIGPTVPELASRLGTAVCNHDKLQFSACIDPIRETLTQRSIRSVVVAGIESHVCVLQTCLDLAGIGYTVAVALDAIGSRRELDQQAAVSRMMQAGIVPTTVEGCLMEMLQQAGTDAFKALLPIIRPLD